MYFKFLLKHQHLVISKALYTQRTYLIVLNKDKRRVNLSPSRAAAAAVRGRVQAAWRLLIGDDTRDDTLNSIAQTIYLAGLAGAQDAQ
jgi:hypothetical protein